ncbi:MAG TPA: hypothetical protein ENI57_11370 [Ignavibacteria bacterium]|nr:hypothetical protein [Ignavibacteria bacterium]
MRTKKILLIIPLFFIVGLMSCAFQSKLADSSMREVRYINGLIHNVNRNVVELSDGSRWVLNRFLVTSNMSEVIVVLFENKLQGFMYVNGNKYFLKPQNVEVDFDTDFLSRKSLGYLTIIKSIDMNIGTITLLGGTEWRISGYYKDIVKNWQAGTDIIISDDYTWAMNLPTYTKAEVKLLASGR